MEKSFNQKFPYIKWKDLESTVYEYDIPSEKIYFKHTLTKKIFCYYDEVWHEVKSKPESMNPYLLRFLQVCCCYQEYTIIM